MDSHIMKRTIFLFLGFLCFMTVEAQFHHQFTSSPDSAEVMVNGMKECYTPCLVSYFWKDNQAGKMIFTMQSEGYELWTDTVDEKPFELTQQSDVTLNRKFPEVQLDSSDVVIGFDKLLADFKENRIIGKITLLDGTSETIEWEGNTKIGAQSFEDSFYSIINKFGFQTPFSRKISLFDGDEDSRPRLPRYVVGIALKDFDIQIIEDDAEDFGSGTRKGTAMMDLEWQVLDKGTGEVMLRYENTGRTNFRLKSGHGSKENLIAFENALMDFLMQSDFMSIVEDTKSIFESATVHTNDSGSVAFEISPSVVPQFESRSQMIKHANKSCVTVITDAGHGSGVTIDPEGYVLSAFHVVDGVNKVQVKFSNGLKLDARVLSYSKAHDVVLLDIEGSGFQSLPLELSTEIDLGEDVITIGTPADLELGQSVSSGILSGKRLHEERVYYQMDMAVSPGNSGGPLLNTNGEIIGIIQRKIVGTGIEGISFALPVATAAEVLNFQVK